MGVKNCKYHPPLYLPPSRGEKKYVQMKLIAKYIRHLGGELIISFALLAGVSLLAFMLLQAAPGSPMDMYVQAGNMAEEEMVAARRELGLEGGVFKQYLVYAGKLCRGDFGYSAETGKAVLPELIEKTGRTLLLTIGAMLVTLLIAVPIALFATLGSRARGSAVLSILAYLLSSAPMFWLGYLVIFAVTRSFYFLTGERVMPLASISWWFILLPIVVLGASNGTVSEIIRYIREQLSRVLREDYIRTARAKGASIVKHSFKEGFLIPVVNAMAAKVPYVLSGAVIVEQVFNYEGLGNLAWVSAQNRDYAVILGIVIFAAVLVRLADLLKNLVYLLVNPRLTAR